MLGPKRQARSERYKDAEHLQVSGQQRRAAGLPKRAGELAARCRCGGSRRCLPNRVWAVCDRNIGSLPPAACSCGVGSNKRLYGQLFGGVVEYLSAALDGLGLAGIQNRVQSGFHPFAAQNAR